MLKMKLATLVAGAALLAAMSGAATAMDKNYTRGTVWGLTMVRVEPGHGDDYIDSLKANFTTVMDQAIKEKVIVSYKIFMGDSSGPNDWNVLIMTEGPNWASIDTAEAKFDVIRAKLQGSVEKADAADREMMTNRAKIRTIFGDKTMQEIHFVK